MIQPPNSRSRIDDHPPPQVSTLRTTHPMMGIRADTPVGPGAGGECRTRQDQNLQDDWGIEAQAHPNPIILPLAAEHDLGPHDCRVVPLADQIAGIVVGARPTE